MSTRVLKFLADESLEYRIVVHLREDGYDVSAISEDTPSISDTEVLRKALVENRVLLTNDKDFGDLVFLNHLSHRGIVLFRFKKEQIQDKLDTIDKLLANYSEKLSNNFVVVDETEVRVRS